MLLNNQQIFSEDMLHQELPFITEETIKILFNVEGLDDLCIDVLNKTYSKYNTVSKIKVFRKIEKINQQYKIN